MGSQRIGHDEVNFTFFHFQISSQGPQVLAYPAKLAGAFREVAVKGAPGEGLETSGFAGPPCAQLGARFVR